MNREIINFIKIKPFIHFDDSVKKAVYISLMEIENKLT